MSVLHLLNTEGDILRDNPTFTNGQAAENYEVITAGVPVRRPYAAGQRELMLAQRLETRVTHVTYVEPEVDIQRSDRLTCEGQAYSVTAVLDPSEPHHRKVLLEISKFGQSN